MRQLLEIFLRFGGLITFLVLEGICLFLIVRYNEEQRIIWQGTLGRITDNIQDRWDNLLDYRLLQNEVDELKQQNAYLRSRLGVALYEDIYSLDTLVADNGATYQEKFVAIPADVINQQSFSGNILLVLDKGRKHQASARMGVLGEQGVIGITTQSTSHYTRVMSLYHRQLNISASLTKNNFFGTLKWDGRKIGVLQLENVPRYAEVHVGDSVVTSGYSNMFPRGLYIGKIRNKRIPSGSDYYELEVTPAEDIFDVHHAYIIRNRHAVELDSLQAGRQ